MGLVLGGFYACIIINVDLLTLRTTGCEINVLLLHAIDPFFQSLVKKRHKKKKRFLLSSLFSGCYVFGACLCYSMLLLLSVDL